MIKAIRLIVLVVILALPSVAQAAKPAKIDRRVDNALADFRENVRGADSVLARAKGVLVFPRIRKAGFGVGGEYGQGALRVNDKTTAYYSTTAASIGFQIGAQARRQIIVFLDEDALESFELSDGWEVGVDASVAVITVGVGGAIDSTQLNQPVVGFVFDGKGLMYNLSLEGSKIHQIHDD